MNVRFWSILAILFITLVAITTSLNGDSNVSAQTPPPLWENITPSWVTPSSTWADGLAVDPSRPGTVYVSTSGDDVSGEGIWKSTNYGTTFTRVDLPFDGGCGPGETFAQNWAFAVDNIGYVFAVNGYGCAQGLFRSTDGGVHWTNVLIGSPVTDWDIGHIEIDPYLPGHMLASTHSDHSCECGGPDIESFDRGTTWRVRNRIVGTGHNNWVHFLNDSNTWVQGAPVGEWRTTDAGLTWAQVSSNDPTHAGQEILRVGNRFYLGSDAGVLFSDNNGVSWTLIPDNSPDGIIAVGTDGNGRLFTRTANVLSASTGPLPMLTSTDGVTWTAYNSQMFINGPNNFSRDSQYLYVSMLRGGVWRLPLTGAPPPPTPTNTPVIVPTATNTPVVPPTPTNTPIVPPTATATPVVFPTATPTPNGVLRSCTLRWGNNTIKNYGQLTQAECAAKGQ